jgi:acetyl-CoA carboxylase carboxyl transferase subunit beta
MDFGFMGGSMGSVVGEKFVRACEQRLSGTCRSSRSPRRAVRGCRGILSLMQLPKTVCAVEDLHDARCALINVFTHPTTAGVLASFASLGDVTIAEPGA